ncbi:MAG: hypothetical protein WCK42_01870 [Myxococcaceae bacterium]
MKGLFNRVFGESHKPGMNIQETFGNSGVIHSRSLDRVESVPRTPLQIKLAGLSPHSEAAKAIKEHLMNPKTETATATVLDHVKTLKKSAKDYESLNSFGRFFNRTFGGSQYKAYKDFYELTAAKSGNSDIKSFFEELGKCENIIDAKSSTQSERQVASGALALLDSTLENSIRGK